MSGINIGPSRRSCLYDRIAHLERLFWKTMADLYRAREQARRQELEVNKSFRFSGNDVY